MAYGRLDVFWPDGTYETFTLAEDSISVGRSTGNTITLETDTISRYHMSITQDGNLIHLTDLDSANGTFVDGVRIQSNQSRQLFGGEEIQIGHLRIIYHVLDDQPTLPISTLAEDTQKIKGDTLDFYMEVFGSEIDIPPGSHTSVEVTIYNTANEKRRFVVMVSGMPEDWIRVNRPQLDVDATDNATVIINIKPLRKSESKPGIYQLKVLIFPISEPMDKLETDVPVNIEPYAGFGMALAKSRVSSGELFRLHVHNQGSANLPLLINGLNREKALTFGIPSSQLVLSAGERQTIQGEIKPKRRRMFGATKEYPFELHIRSRDEARFLAVVPGIFNERPAFPTWVAYAVGSMIAVLIGLVILALVLVLNNSASEPTVINTFTVDNNAVIQGETVQFTWDIEHADDITLSIDDVPIEANLADDSTGYTLDTSNYNGVLIVVLEADGSQRVAQSLTLTVNLPLTIEVFAVTPSTLVRNVVQNLSVQWRVTGATSTQITGISAFSQSAVEASQGEEGSIEVPGFATDTFSLTLIASDDADNTIESVIDIDVIDPICTSLGEVTLHELTNPESNVLSTLPEETEVVVTARDSLGGWLQVRLAGDAIGWGLREQFICADTFNPDSLRIDPSTTPTSE